MTPTQLTWRKHENPMRNICINSTFASTCPRLRVGIIEAMVVNSESSPALWSEIDKESSLIVERYPIEHINKRPAIQANRQAYRAFGKDPNRYRVSSEALCRRLVRGLGLYRINNLVDLINLVSIRSGYAIGAFDADCIVGDNLTLGVGQEGELFHGIGRGALNIEGLPVYRDQVGGIGTPTSDEERTKLTLDTTRLLVLINAYGEEQPLDETITYTVSLLQQYASATEINTAIIAASSFKSSTL